jgi:hypothetical protein
MRGLLRKTEKKTHSIKLREITSPPLHSLPLHRQFLFDCNASRRRLRSTYESALVKFLLGSKRCEVIVAWNHKTHLIELKESSLSL